MIASWILREQAGEAKGNTLEAASRYAPELVMPVSESDLIALG